MLYRQWDFSKDAGDRLGSWKCLAACPLPESNVCFQVWCFEVVFESQKRLIQKQVALNQNLALRYKSTGCLSARKGFLSGNYMTDKDWGKAGESLGTSARRNVSVSLGYEEGGVDL